MKPSKPTWIETKIVRSFRKSAAKPRILFALEGLGNGWGVIDFSYRELYLRLETEKFVAGGFIALNGEFTPSWWLQDVLRLAIGTDPGFISEEAVCKLLVAHYDAIVGQVTSDAGKARLATIQSPAFESWFRDAAAWRAPGAAESVATRTAELRNQFGRGWGWWLWRTIGVLIALLWFGFLGFLGLRSCVSMLFN